MGAVGLILDRGQGMTAIAGSSCGAACGRAGASSTLQAALGIGGATCRTASRAAMPVLHTPQHLPQLLAPAPHPTRRDAESLDRAMALNGTSLHGRKIKMGYAQPKKQ